MANVPQLNCPRECFRNRTRRDGRVNRRLTTARLGNPVCRRNTIYECLSVRTDITQCECSRDVDKQDRQIAESETLP